MELFGLSITRAPRREKSYPVPAGSGGWWPIWPNVQEPYTGAWQANAETSVETIVSHSAVFACVTLIASDIAKMRLRLVEQDDSGIWEERESPAFSPVLRKPNGWQNRIQFIQWWIASKLIHGNTYVLKVRDGRRVVTGLYVLDPTHVRPLVSPDGSVFYALSADNLATLNESQIVPAREIIHDRMVSLYHPLVGVSPIHASAMAAIQGLRIQSNSTRFFLNGSNPGGVLTAPGAIAKETADRLKAYWDTNFSGDNVGKVAVLGDGLKYEQMFVNAHDSQLIEQLKWTAETVCSTFHVPPYMIGVGEAPTYNNIEALNQQYYSQCLQSLIEAIELALDQGLELPTGYGTEFDLDDLLRMDSATMMTTIQTGVAAGVLAPNEGRAKINLRPVRGGDTPYLQVQNYSLAALDRRDSAEPPPPTPEPTPADGDADQLDEGDDNAQEASFDAHMQAKALEFAGRMRKRERHAA
jgi:HK97 family phage portal protein